MRRVVLAGIVGLAACGGGDLRVVGTDDGRFDGAKVWAELADVEANETVEIQQSRVRDDAFEFVFAEPPDGGALAVQVQVELVKGTGCGPAIEVEVDGVQIGAVEVDTREFTGSECLGARAERAASDE